ncbi:MAG: hypothetical protein ACRC4L_02365, partial [Mycoplasma sp.]
MKFWTKKKKTGNDGLSDTEINVEEVKSKIEASIEASETVTKPKVTSPKKEVTTKTVKKASETIEVKEDVVKKTTTKKEVEAKQTKTKATKTSDKKVVATKETKNVTEEPKAKVTKESNKKVVTTKETKIENMKSEKNNSQLESEDLTNSKKKENRKATGANKIPSFSADLSFNDKVDMAEG